MKLSYRWLADTRRRLAKLSILIGVALLFGAGGVAKASIIDSKHNLSSSGPGPVKATSETQMCVFCHTPHGSDQTAGAPLWNRAQSTATYAPYLSSSMDTMQPTGDPAASSKVCLSCHDGMLAIGVVINLNSKVGAKINMSGTGTGGVMPDQHDFVIPDIANPGQNTVVTLSNTGYTRNLGVDMSNDHPISFTYNSTLSSNNGELRSPGNAVVGTPSFGVKPTFPLEKDSQNNSQMQCGTCHDPHLSTNSSPKFLRGLRLQVANPSPNNYVLSGDIMCVACHDKDNGAGAWTYSAHANVNVATEAYTDVAANIREFPLNTLVWQSSCLGCHDTHTVPGARRLLREGTNSNTIPKSGGSSAMEETCYQCHSAQGGTNVLNQVSPPNTVPDIKSDFLDPNIRMPISALTETHDTGGTFDDSTGVSGGIATGSTGSCKTGSKCSKDLMESEALLGKPTATSFGVIGSIFGAITGNIANRHTECSDCHNPHRTTKNRLFNANAATPDAAGTHQHNIANGVAHSNIASGALRGSFGVEPVYPATAFGTLPTTFTVKRGDPGLSGTAGAGNAYVTREYQVCLKCHSNYAYDTPDSLGYTGGTPSPTNGFYRYLNTAMEFQAPATDKVNLSVGDSGAYATFSANNQRSWHPVMDNTGRTVADRGNASPNLWRAPWNGSDIDGLGASLLVAGGAVGNQTMYCSDCHGSVTTTTNGVVPDGNGFAGAWTEDGKPWGPHGSAANFILKGPSDTKNPTGAGTDTLCFRCHDATQYADASGAPATVLTSGFSAVGTDNAYGQPMNNLHQRHAYYTTQGGVSHATTSVWPASANGTYRCTMCHTGTAHGWKNKDFLVNLNDVGPELNKADVSDLNGGALGGEIAPGPITLTNGQPVPSGTQVPGSMASVLTGGYTNGPYYQGALLYIANTGFKASGTWAKSDCANSGCH